MATCRVYLLTYRRHNLLPRALDSLLSQDMHDWICEVHNDDPMDPFPEKLLSEVNDPRLTVVNHAENLGPTRTFNLVFKQVPEPFICLLEDDNWWEPHFLSTMIQNLNNFPEVQVAWANMRLWQENKDGTWLDTRKNIWDCSPEQKSQLFNWGQEQQIMGALHSNGTMVIRSQATERFIIPAETPSSAVEHVRERAFPFPILLVPKVCANFAITQNTSRSKSRVSWAQVQTLLIASFFKHSRMEKERIKQFWLERRVKTARSTNGLFFAALLRSECRNLLLHANLSDWLFFFASSIRRPHIVFKSLQSIKAYPELWDFLDRHTADRAKEARDS